MTHDQAERDEKPEAEASRPRREYRRPALTEYGSVAKLTQGSQSVMADGGSGGFRMTCL